MKVVILAGGLPSTINEEVNKIPKPMVRVGERPLLWHIMKLYSYYGFNDFVICTGYKSELIKEYFMNYYVYKSDVAVDLQKNEVKILNKETENWNVTIVYTGEDSTTSTRVLGAKNFLDGEDFIVTYGDCVSDINIKELVETHKNGGKLLTMAVTRPVGRNALLPIKNNETGGGSAWANACNMVVSKGAYEYIHPEERFEIDTVNRIIHANEADTYEHNGLWVPVETMRDKELLESVWRGLIYNQ